MAIHRGRFLVAAIDVTSTPDGMASHRRFVFFEDHT
jgi:hypothetical protein